MPIKYKSTTNQMYVENQIRKFKSNAHQMASGIWSPFDGHLTHIWLAFDWYLICLVWCATVVSFICVSTYIMCYWKCWWEGSFTVWTSSVVFLASFVRNFSVFFCLVSTMHICSENSGQLREDLVKDQTCQSSRQRKEGPALIVLTNSWLVKLYPLRIADFVIRFADW